MAHLSTLLLSSYLAPIVLPIIFINLSSHRNAPDSCVFFNTRTATPAPHLPPLYQPVSSRGYQDDDTPGVEGHVSCHDAAVDLGRRAGSSRHGR